MAAATLSAAPLAGAPCRPPPGRARRLSGARVLDVAVILGAAAAAVAMAVRANTVLGYRWDWSVIPTYFLRTDPATGHLAANLLLTGLLTTLRLAAWSLMLGAVLGTAVAAMRVSSRPALRWLGRIFVELVRNVPPVVLVFVFTFFVSSQVLPALGLDTALRAAPAWVQAACAAVLAPPERINDTVAGLACLSLLAAAYIAEIVRAGLGSVPLSQVEAGRALGLRPFAVFRLVVLPPALRAVLPALAGQFIVSVKDSSLVSLISIQELTFMASEVSGTTRRFFEVWLFTAALYFVVCFSFSLLFRGLERRWAVRA